MVLITISNFVVVLYLYFPYFVILEGDGSGNYAVFSTNNLHVQLGAHGEMTSLPITANGTICVTFWYNMPTNKATLTVYKRYPRNVFPDEVLWKQGQMETKGWHEVSVVMHSNNTFKVNVLESWEDPERGDRSDQPHETP